MKSLSDWDAARCDEHPFRAKIKVSTLAVFELSLFDKWSEQRNEGLITGKNFKISHKISRFHARFQDFYKIPDFNEDFCKISRF